MKSGLLGLGAGLLCAAGLYPQAYQPQIAGHHLLLSNRSAGTKTREVWAAHSTSTKGWRIDRQAMELFQRHAAPDSALIVMPVATALSPDETQALIKMELIYLSVSTAQQAGRLGRSYRRYDYSVDTSSGHVEREFRAGRVPAGWWEPHSLK